MSCGARLPIYALLLPAFFPQAWQAPILWVIYLTGIVMAILMARLLRSTLFKGEPAPFVMELPPYRIPSFRDAVLHTWERSGLYLKKAGTIIVGISILLWALTNFPKPPAEYDQDGTAALAYSYAGRAGKAMEPVLSPMGFDWKIGTALVGAFAAKEVFVAQMGIIYAVGEGDAAEEPLREHLRKTYRPLVGFCIMLFCLIGSPCMVTVAVTRRESGGWRWAALQFGGLTLLAYLVTTLVYQVGTYLG
jgi:ferrous iron transport protein B